MYTVMYQKMSSLHLTLSSYEEQGAVIVQRPGTGPRPSLVYLFEDTDWILTQEFMCLGTQEENHMHNTQKDPAHVGNEPRTFLL